MWADKGCEAPEQCCEPIAGIEHSILYWICRRGTVGQCDQSKDLNNLRADDDQH